MIFLDMLNLSPGQRNIKAAGPAGRRYSRASGAPDLLDGSLAIVGEHAFRPMALRPRFSAGLPCICRQVFRRNAADCLSIKV